MRLRNLILIILFFNAFQSFAQSFSVKGKIQRNKTGEPIISATVSLRNTNINAITDESGTYHLKEIKPGSYMLIVSAVGSKIKNQTIEIIDKDIEVNIDLEKNELQLKTVEIQAEKEKTFGVSRLKAIEGTAIYAGKKSEVVEMEDITANKATNNSRQIYSKVAGLNIWENDGAGIQLGIGGRGLNPNRVSNFNTRQNGYDISADALGYPESYYSPSAEAIDRIEIVRGAASLQYGTQFGGLVNFKLKEGSEDKAISLASSQTLGSWGFFNTFNSIGGTAKKLQYYTFYQHKSGNGWRNNSEFNVDIAYASLNFKPSEKLSISLQYTFMDYLAHQPGGLTDKQFEENPNQSFRNRNWFKVNWNLGALSADYIINTNLKFNTRFFGLLASRSALGILTYINRADPGGVRDLWIDKYKNYGNETRLLYTYDLSKEKHNLLVGFRYYNGNTNREQGEGNSGSTGKREDFKFTSSSLEYSKYVFPNHNISIFAENIFRLTQKLSIIPGIRYEKIITNAEGSYTILNKDFAGNIIYNQQVNETRDNSRQFIIGGIGLSYYRSTLVQAYTSSSQNYRAINFNDMRVVNPNLQIDPDLQDEKGYSADIGFRGNSAVFNYDISLFVISYANRIGTVLKVDPTTFNIYRLRTNISESRNLGLETFAEIDFWRAVRKKESDTKLTLFSNFSWIDARYIHSKQTAIANKKVELAPDILLKIGSSFKRKKLSVSYQISYTSEQFTDASNATFTSNAINGLISSYYVMDLSAEYVLNKYLLLQGTINNISDNRYFTRRADSYPGPGIIPADARSFFITLQFKI